MKEYHADTKLSTIQIRPKIESDAARLRNLEDPVTTISLIIISSRMTERPSIVPILLSVLLLSTGSQHTIRQSCPRNSQQN